MEQIIAYKAFNGKVFEDKEKCLAYEKKHAQYPKVKHSVIPQVEGVEKCVKSTWQKPSSQREDESYFLVGGKYKIYDKSANVGEMVYTHLLRGYWHPLDRVAINVILNNGMTFNTELAEKVCEIYNKHAAEQAKQSTYKYTMCAEITETDNETYWIIEDKVKIFGRLSTEGRYVKIVKV